MTNWDQPKWQGSAQADQEVYFSDREKGPVQRTGEIISREVWDGLAALIASAVERGSFGQHFPETCPDGRGISGTDRDAFAAQVRAEIPGLVWPQPRIDSSLRNPPIPDVPSVSQALDLVEFCFRHIAKPIQGQYHAHFGHHHLTFHPAPGQDEFRGDVNRILARNGLAFELGGDGRVRRLAPPVLREELTSAVFRSGDSTLDIMLEESRKKFLSPDPILRKEALERLWDSWERLKTLKTPANKNDSIEQLLRIVAREDPLFNKLNAEGRELTKIGNEFHIRHTEIGKVPLDDPRHVDYLFHRLFALIHLILGALGNKGAEGQI